MPVTIHTERPDSQDASMLIQELDAILSPLYPQESRHGYSIDKLIEQQVAFFVIRRDGKAAGCAGLQFFDERSGIAYGEIKRMYVRPAFRGLGLARLLLEQLEETAVIQGVEHSRLETGIYQTAAIRLYERNGFVRIGPFGEYRADPLSLYLEKRVPPAANTRKTLRG